MEIERKKKYIKIEVILNINFHNQKHFIECKRKIVWCMNMHYPEINTEFMK